MYELPEFNLKIIQKKFSKALNNESFQAIFLVLVTIAAIGVGTGNFSIDSLKEHLGYLSKQNQGTIQEVILSNQAKEGSYASKIEYERAVIDAVKKASPAVASIIISKNLPVYEQQFINPFDDFPGFNVPFNIQVPEYVQKGTKLQEVGAGSGFIISEDGLIVTNKHVVLDKQAAYTVLTNDHRRYPAKVLAVDPVQDLAIIKIQSDNKFPSLKIGDSDSIEIGQGAIAIGNALGEFRNTVSVGIISGLGRTISASGGSGFSEVLENVIQTDAAINQGNSGGPLLNLQGEVIGVNTAMAQGAQSIGFAIPINVAKRDIGQVVKNGAIIYPFLGVRYLMVDAQIQQKYNLPVDYGALVLRGENGESAVAQESAAQKAGMKEKDLILKIDGQNITLDDPLSKIISKYNPGDTVRIKVWRGGEEIILEAVLGERN